jgi:hypothetical protein
MQRLGPNIWLMCIMVVLELLVIVKFGLSFEQVLKATQAALLFHRIAIVFLPFMLTLYELFSICNRLSKVQIDSAARTLLYNL